MPVETNISPARHPFVCASVAHYPAPPLAYQRRSIRLWYVFRAAVALRRSSLR